MTEITESELQRRVDRERQRLRDIEVLRRRLAYLDGFISAYDSDRRIPQPAGLSYDRAEAQTLRRSIERLEESA